MRDGHDATRRIAKSVAQEMTEVYRDTGWDALAGMLPGVAERELVANAAPAVRIRYARADVGSYRCSAARAVIHESAAVNSMHELQ